MYNISVRKRIFFLGFFGAGGLKRMCTMSCIFFNFFFRKRVPSKKRYLN